MISGSWTDQFDRGAAHGNKVPDHLIVILGLVFPHHDGYVCVCVLVRGCCKLQANGCQREGQGSCLDLGSTKNSQQNDVLFCLESSSDGVVQLGEMRCRQRKQVVVLVKLVDYQSKSKAAAHLRHAA